MKLTFFLVLVAFLELSASAYSQSTKLDINVENEKFENIILEIKRSSGFKFLYQADWFENLPTMSIKVYDKSVEQILDELIVPYGFEYEIKDQTVIFKKTGKKTTLPSRDVKYEFQDITVQGKVLDEQGEGLPGATVMIKGTSVGTTTNVDGEYSLSAPENGTLVVSFVGYLSKELAISNRSAIDIVLAPDVQSLEELVIVGYGKQKKSVVTGAISKVEGKEIEKVGVPNLNQALQGQVSGVHVGNSSGAPGSQMNVIIRGANTNGDFTPIYIVDGVPTKDISHIAPGDVSSMEVLKDAASAAIYGARGANGVIMVTTKRGKEGTVLLNYDGYIGMQEVWRKPETLNASEYRKLIADRQGISENDPLLSGSANTDWFDEIFNPAKVQSHSLSVSSGNDKGSYYMSVSYFDQGGIINSDKYDLEKSNFERYTARINGSYKVKEYLTIGENFSFTSTKRQIIPENNRFSSVLADALNYDPLTSPILSESETDFFNRGWNQSPLVQKEHVNPLSRIDINNLSRKTNRFFGNLYAAVTPVENLQFKTDISIDISNSENSDFIPKYNFHAENFRPQNTISQGTSESSLWQWENTVSYSRSFGNHNTAIVLGTTALKENNSYINAQRNGIPDVYQDKPSWWVLDGAPNNTAVNDGRVETEHTLASIFGRINYNFKEKYLLSVVLRRDGSSRFGPNNRHAIFPAVSGGWIVSQENFWKSSLIDFFKIKASWGKNGNENIGDSRYIPTVVTGVRTYEFGKNYGLPGSETFHQGSSPEVIYNPNVKWEETSSYDIGVDMDLLGGKIHFEMDYFQKRTKNLLLINDAIPDYAGTRPSEANLGEVENKGLEFVLSHRNTLKNGLTYHASFNGTFLKNEVLKVPNSNKFVDGAIYPVFNAVITRMEEGKPMGYFRGYQVLGVFQNDEQVETYTSSDGTVIQPNASPGDFKFEDVNNDGKITNDDLQELGKPWADFTFGGSVGAEFKNFDFSLLLTGSVGNDIYSVTDRPEVAFRNAPEFWTDRWTPSNPSNEIPRAGNDGVNLSPSSFMVQDGSFVRFRNIQLGYSLPKSWVEKVNIQKFRLYVALDNYFTITNYRGFDPELGTRGSVLEYGLDYGFYPSPKTIRFGLNISL